jgi:hypothetical protein
MMRTYARIQADLVAELFTTDEDIAELFHPDLVWVDVGAAQPAVGWAYAGGVFSPPPSSVPTLAEQIAAAVRQIDADADRIYGDVLGNRGEEYKAAEADAKAFKTAGYSGAAPVGVASWVAASGMSAQSAADDILVTAEAWRDAMGQIRTQRLWHKEQARRAVDRTALDLALAQWSGFVAAMRIGLGL